MQAQPLAQLLDPYAALGHVRSMHSYFTGLSFCIRARPLSFWKNGSPAASRPSSMPSAAAKAWMRPVKRASTSWVWSKLPSATISRIWKLARRRSPL
ncbi:hypothetical protein SCYAM73S_01688 [Streptomyces cyaneofuscatus]